MSKSVYSKIDKIPRGFASNRMTEGCLVLEGGAFRGLYNQGVLDAWMKMGLNFSCVIGVSAGALAGMNYVSGQIGRSARANLGYRHDKNYIGRGAVRKSHSLIRLDFLFKDFQNIEPLYQKRFDLPEQRFIAVATNCETGEATYFEKGQCSDIMSAIKASASMPFVTPAVEIDGQHYLDGGCSCKIPYQWAIDQGYEKIVVVRTREAAYRKKVKDNKTAEVFYKNYPEFAQKLDRSNADYNIQCTEIEELEAEGRLFVLAPEKPVDVSRVEGNMEKLGALYWAGYHDAIRTRYELRDYLRK